MPGPEVSTGAHQWEEQLGNLELLGLDRGGGSGQRGGHVAAVATGLFSVLLGVQLLTCEVEVRKR